MCPVHATAQEENADSNIRDAIICRQTSASRDPARFLPIGYQTDHLGGNPLRLEPG
jgi:hypothetical protein